MIKVALVDDHALFREGLNHVLSNSEDFSVVFEASNGKEFLYKLEQDLPDVVLMDVSMPEMDGVTATSLGKSKYPSLKIIALSMFSDVENYEKMNKAGVNGFLIKEIRLNELKSAIKEVYQGGSYFSRELLQNVITQMSKEPQKQHSIKFTLREREVLDLITKGYTNKEISEALFISVKTVEGCKTTLLEKTGTKNSINLILYCLKNHIVDIGE